MTVVTRRRDDPLTGMLSWLEDPRLDLDVHVSGDHLVVGGSREAAQHEKYRHEFHYGSCYRAGE